MAVLTNGSLLWQEEVRRGLKSAHLVIPSLDAGDQGMFTAINRPHPSITFDLMKDGLAAFRDEYSGQLWLEVFILGTHGPAAEAEKIAACGSAARPDRIHLNTVNQAPAEDFRIAVERGRQEEIATLFSPVAEVNAESVECTSTQEFHGHEGHGPELLSMRPGTLEDISSGLGIHLNEAVKYVEELLAQGFIEQVRLKGVSSYRIRSHT